MVLLLYITNSAKRSEEFSATEDIYYRKYYFLDYQEREHGGVVKFC